MPLLIFLNSFQYDRCQMITKSLKRNTCNDVYYTPLPAHVLAPHLLRPVGL